MSACMGYFCLNKARQKAKQEKSIILASETSFTVNEVEALYDLFKKLSSSIIDDRLIHKEEFKLALFKNSSKQNLFADRIPAFGIHDNAEFLASSHENLMQLKEMVLAILTESDLTVPDDIVESIVEKTIMEADTKREGKIDEEEWKEFVAKYPSLLKMMTLPCLKDITMAFPSFVWNTDMEEDK